MTTQVSHKHHVIPQLHLRGFAAGRHLVEHRRDGTVQQVTVKQAAVVEDFYSIESGAAAEDALEDWFGKNIESPAAEVIKALRRGEVPPSNQRTAAAFVAFQIVRGPGFRRRLRQMGTHLGPLLFGVDVVSKVLQSDPGWKPDDATLQHMMLAAAARAPKDIGHPSHDADHRTMIREAHRLMDMLLAMKWSVCAAPKDVLLVGDTPAVVRDALGEQLPGVLTLPDRFEVLMPVSPKRLLVVSPFVTLGEREAILSRDFAHEVNAASIRACETSVFHHPEMAFPAELSIPRRSPAIDPPTVTSSISNSTDPKTLAAWPAIPDAAFEEAIRLLGGNPPLP